MKVLKSFIILFLLYVCFSHLVFADDLNEYNICVPVVMYHEISDVSNGENEYCISTNQLVSDFEEFKKAGFTPIKVSEFIMLSDAYKEIETAENGKVKKEKIKEFKKLIAKYPNPVLITLDDGYKDGLDILLPQLNKYNFKANIAIVGNYSTGSPEFLSFDDIKKLYESGKVEFGNHTSSIHSYTYEECMEYCVNPDNRGIILDDYFGNDTLLYHITGVRPSYFAYPYGICSETTEDVLDELGTRVSFVTSMNSNFTTLKNSLRKISRINRTPAFSSGELVRKLINGIKITSPEAYKAFGKTLALYMGEKVEERESVGVSVEIKNDIYLIAGFKENDKIVISEDETEKLPDCYLLYDENGNIKQINAFDKKIILFSGKTILFNEEGICEVKLLTEKGNILVENLFKLIDFNTQFSEDKNMLEVCKKYTSPFKTN